MLLAGLAMLSMAHADEKSKSGRKIWVMMGATPKQLGQDHFLITDEEPMRLPQSRRMILGPISMPESGAIKIAKAEQSILETQIPKDIQDVLAILVPTPDEEGKLKFKTLFRDLKKFTPGSWLFINHTSSQIRVKLGEEQVLLKPGEDNIFKSPTGTPKGTTGLSFEVRKDDKGQWALLTSTTVAINQARREVCIFSNKPNTAVINYHGVTLNIIK